MRTHQAADEEDDLVSTKVLIGAMAAIVIVGGAAIAVTQYIFRPSNDEAIALVPEDAQFYLNVFMRPSNGQKRAIEDLLEAGDVTPDEATDRIAEVVNSALEDVGLTFEEDIDPTIGNQAAVFASDFGATLETEAPLTEGGPEATEAALLVAIKDRSKADGLIDVAGEETDAEIAGQEDYEGYEYTLYKDDSAVGFVGDFAVIGTEAGFKAVVDTAEGDDSLDSSDAYQDVTGRLNDDNLGILYFNFASIVDDARESGALTPEDENALELAGDSLEKPYAIAAYAASEGVVIESAMPIPSEGALSELFDVLTQETSVEDLPANSWIALGVPEVGRLVELFFEIGAQLEEVAEADMTEIEEGFEAETGLNLREHVFEGLKGVRFFISGGIGPGTRGAIIADTADEDVATDIMDALRGFAEEQGVAVSDLDLEGYETGFSFLDPSGTDSVHTVVDGARIVTGFGDEATRAALEGGESLAGSEKFGGATELLDDYEPYFYLGLDPPLAAFRNFIAPMITDYPESTLDPLLDAASSIAVGGKRDGDYLMQKLILGVEQE
jgi:hypothetical protein